MSTGFPTHKRTDNLNIHYYWEFTLRSHGVRRDGAASLDLCSVACGRFEAFWEFGLKSWDTAAGMLIVTEAGGKVTDLAGELYHPGGSSVLVSNGRDVYKRQEAGGADLEKRVFCGRRSLGGGRETFSGSHFVAG